MLSFFLPSNEFFYISLFYNKYDLKSNFNVFRDVRGLNDFPGVPFDIEFFVNRLLYVVVLRCGRF